MGRVNRTVLTYKMGLRVWFDVIDISGGKWKKQIDEVIPKSQYVIAIFYNGWEEHLEEKIANDEFLYEVRLANKSGCRIIPFFSHDYSCEDLLHSKSAPQWLKKLFNGPNSHNSIVKYCHTAIGETYKKLQQQLIDTKLILRLTITSPDYQIMSIIVGNREIPQEEILVNGGCVSLDRHFRGVVKVTFQKLAEVNIGETATIRIGVRKHRDWRDSDICDRYWEENEIDMDIDEPRISAKPLYYDCTFNWNTYQDDLRRRSDLYNLDSDKLY